MAKTPKALNTQDHKNQIAKTPDITKLKRQKARRCNESNVQMRELKD